MTDTRKPFETMFREAVWASLSRVHTVFPGLIQSFDRTLRTAEIQPCIFGDDGTPCPVLPDVPILFMHNNLFYFEFDLLPGSPVLCLAAERSLEQWKTKGTLTESGDVRKYHLSDCVAIPGLMPLPNLPPVPIDAGSAALRNSTNTQFIKATVAGFEIMGNLSITGNVDVTGVIKSNTPIVTLAAHVHSVKVPSGGGTVTTAVPTPGF